MLTTKLLSGIGSDTVPNAFTVPDVSGAELNTQYSASVTPTGYDTLTPWSVSGGGTAARTSSNSSYATSGTLLPGETLTVRGNSPGAYSTSVNATVTIGGISDTWTITTRAADVTPNVFTFADVTGATTSTQYTATVTPAGYETAVNWSISGGNGSGQGGVAGGAYATSGTISPGQSLTVRATSNSNGQATDNYTITIGGISDTWSITTAAVVGEAVFTTPGTFNLTVPVGVTSICAVAIGTGGGNRGGGGALVYTNNWSVTPGEMLEIRIGARNTDGYSSGGSSWVRRGGTYMTATGGQGGGDSGSYGGVPGGVYGAGYSGGNGRPYSAFGGAGGAGGYSGNGGQSGDSGSNGTAGTGGAPGGGAGGAGGVSNGGAGGGVGLYGQGANGAGGSYPGGGGAEGSGGSSGGSSSNTSVFPNGGACGGGGVDQGAYGAVRIIWGPGRSFPNNAT